MVGFRVKPEEKYSEELESAFSKIFGDPVVGYESLGLHGSLGLARLGLSQKSSPAAHHGDAVRVSMLKRLLINWVMLKGDEVEEFGDGEDLVRIRAEARATLLVLREMNTYFPDVEPASKKEFTAFESSL